VAGAGTGGTITTTSTARLRNEFGIPTDGGFTSEYCTDGDHDDRYSIVSGLDLGRQGSCSSSDGSISTVRGGGGAEQSLMHPLRLTGPPGGKGRCVSSIDSSIAYCK